MAPIPDENQTNPLDSDPRQDDVEDLEGPSHVIPPLAESSSDGEGGAGDSEGEGEDLASQGYVLLPQEPDEDDNSDDDGDDDGDQTQAWPPLSALDADQLPKDSLTEVRGAGVDVSAAVAQGLVHPTFAASFPDNKVPVHLQMPEAPKKSKEEVLWNQSSPSERLHFDSAHVSKIKSAMAGFQLPNANIPAWARHVPEDTWKQRLVNRVTAPPSKGDRVSAPAATMKDKSQPVSAGEGTVNGSCVLSGQGVDPSDSWPGTET